MISVADEFKRVSKQIEELSNAIIVNPFSDDFFDVFTKKRMELIRSIMNDEPRSIRELATTVERDIKNVFDDLQVLHNFNIINFESEGKCKRPIIIRKTIIFRFSGDNNE